MSVVAAMAREQFALDAKWSSVPAKPQAVRRRMILHTGAFVQATRWLYEHEMFLKCKITPNDHAETGVEALKRLADETEQAVAELRQIIAECEHPEDFAPGSRCKTRKPF